MPNMFFLLISVLIVSVKSKSFNETAFNSTFTSNIRNTSSVVPSNLTADGKTYFFRYDATNQQFKITSRVKLDSDKNFTQPLINKKFIGNLEKSNMNELRRLEAFLDDEWNYSSSKRINATELPLQIHPFLYKNMLDKATRKSDTGEKVPEVTKIIFNKKNSNSSIFNFNLGKLEQNQYIDNAEVHFYWLVPKDSEFNRNSCVLRLYEVTGENDSVSEKNPDTHKLLNVIYVSKAQTGWQMFRINRKSIAKWANMTENLKMLISLSQANQVNSTTVFNDTDNETKWRSFLILKILDESNEEEYEIAPMTNSTSSYKGAFKYCSRKEFYVDFRKLHWSNFIIAPDGFMAYDCYGKCTRHNTDSFSNHLKMLNTFQDVDKKLRTPCCVPTKFYSLPVMFYDRFGNVLIKIYRDLVAAQCGCR